MGKSESKQATPKEPALIDKPWRDIEWDSSVKDNLKAAVKYLSPKQVEVPFFNILMTGQVGAGKSSFYNSVNSIYRGHIYNPACAGNQATSLTKHYRTYDVRTRSDADRLPLRICDIIGLQADSPDETDVRNILAAIDGHVPDRHEFKESGFYQGSDGWIASPLLEDKAHCVAIVIDAAVVWKMRELIWNKLRSIRKALLDRQVPVFILLTKIDKACQYVKDDITRVYRSKAVRSAIERTSKKLDLSEENIFPIQNYRSEFELEVPKDILLLYAVHQMLLAAQDYLHKPGEPTLHAKPWRDTNIGDKGVHDALKQEVAAMKPELHCSMDVPYFNILLAGEIGAGKSSFVNSVHDHFRGKMMDKAAVGIQAKSLTKHFRIYDIQESATSEPFKWRICDTMGFEQTKGIDAEHILAAVDGKIPDGSEFSEDILNETEPSVLSEKAHCVAVVVDAQNCSLMKAEIWKKLKKLREGLIERGVPVFILLTKIDLLCPYVHDDVTMVFRSAPVEKAVDTTSKKLGGLQRKRVFPIQNYEQEMDISEDAKGVLLLYAVRQMLNAAQGYLESQQKARPHKQPVENTTGRGNSGSPITQPEELSELFQQVTIDNE